MSFEITGRLHRKYETETKGASFKVQEFVLEVQDGNYPQMIKFQAVQDKCGMIDKYEIGHEVNVHFDLRGREWNDKFFTNLNAWKVENAGGAPAGNQDGFEQGGFDQSVPPNTDESSFSAEDDDDLPF